MKKKSEAQKERESIQRFMHANKLNVNSWSKKAGVTESTLRSFLNNKEQQSMRTSTLRKLANAVGVTIDHILLFGEENRNILIDVTKLQMCIKRVLNDAKKYQEEEKIELPTENIATSIAGLYQLSIIEGSITKELKLEESEK